MNKKLKGKAWVAGDDIDTDQIYHGQYLPLTDPKEMAKHAMEFVPGMENFAKEVKPGDMLVAGKNFGCGSSREQPVIGLKAVGIAAVVAESFGRIFYRASINQGLLLIECPDAVKAYNKGDYVTLNVEHGKIIVGGKAFSFPDLPEEILAIRDGGFALAHHPWLPRSESQVELRRIAARGRH